MKKSEIAYKHPILTSTEMKELDNYIIGNVKIPSKLLMENAASYASVEINNLIPKHSNLLILCGVGNNGGDGLSIVRHLYNYHNVQYVVIGDKSKFSEDAQSNYDILQNMNILEISLEQLNTDKYDCIIDAVFGIGFKLPLKENYKDLFSTINKIDCCKIAIDIPSGLDSDNGVADKNAFIAEYTLTMYAYKSGLILNDGKDKSGIVIVLNLGIPNEIINSFSHNSIFTNYISAVRKKNTSKFDYGKCFIIAGSENMSGAGCLTANAAISAGSGLVYLCTTKIHNHLLPEVITYEIEEYNAELLENETIVKTINGCNSIVIGPGIGNNDNTKSLIDNIIENYSDKEIIIDADGISALNINKKYSSNITITPHIGEFSRLIGVNREEVYNLLPNIVIETAKKMNINILLKGPTTIISDGNTTNFVANGTPKMATAGSGDVLAGILGVQLSQSHFQNKVDRISNGVQLHINASLQALYVNSSITASDIVQGLKWVK